MVWGSPPINVTRYKAQAQRPLTIRISDRLMPAQESTKLLGLLRDSHLSIKKHISPLKTQCNEALNLIRVIIHLKWGGDKYTLVMLYQTLVDSKLDYCVLHSIQYQSTTTGRHTQRWTKTGTGNFLHQPSLQCVHWVQGSSFGRTSIEAVHALFENSCLH